MTTAPSREQVLPGTATSIGPLRSAVATFAQEAGANAKTVANVRLAVSEAATNAVRHAYAEGTVTGEIRVRAHVDGAVLVIAIADDGPGVRPRPDSPGLGLGLPLIAQVADRLDVLDGRPGAIICMRFALP